MADPLAVEQRADPRVEVALEVHLSRKVGKEVVAHTCDLSVSGARITSDRPLRVDEELRFDLELRSASTAAQVRTDADLEALRVTLPDWPPMPRRSPRRAPPPITTS